MTFGLNRRTFLAASAAASLPMPAIAQSKPVRIGLLTVKSGPLAQGGLQMIQGVELFIKTRNKMIAGRPIELIIGDTGGNPAGTKSKAQELIERDHVDMIFGPLAAFELLAISNYVAEHKTPILSLAAAEDMTQRKPNPYFVRASGTSAQPMHPLADFARKELHYKTAITISEDFAFGYEQMGGFQRVFDDEGGRVVNKLWPPIVTPDYTPYLAQMSGVDVIVQGFAGSNPLKFMKQYHDAGLKIPVLGGGPAGDDALMKSFGDEALGMVSASAYTSDLDTPSNKKFVAGMIKETGSIPGLYAAGMYINGLIAEAALKKLGGKTDDKKALITAMRAVSLEDSPRGPFHFDHFGNVVGNIFIRRVVKQNGKLAQHTIKTYHNVSQFWTFKEKWFLEQPVYSRNYPPLLKS
ncbi:MAG TPA: ABC transporter substrate-binding protein [Acetobacteraceae bacterium]|nr:ABC transporter substrate-binding protein [Acetobacteraceae bacterium]